MYRMRWRPEARSPARGHPSVAVHLTVREFYYRLLLAVAAVHLPVIIVPVPALAHPIVPETLAADIVSIHLERPDFFYDIFGRPAVDSRNPAADILLQPLAVHHPGYHEAVSYHAGEYICDIHITCIQSGHDPDVAVMHQCDRTFQDKPELSIGKVLRQVPADSQRVEPGYLLRRDHIVKRRIFVIDHVHQCPEILLSLFRRQAVGDNLRLRLDESRLKPERSHGILGDGIFTANGKADMRFPYRRLVPGHIT